MAKPIVSQQTYCPRMDILIGDSVLVELLGVGGRFKTVFVGMVPGKALIVRYPSQQLELREHMYPEKALLVRYLSSGNIYGFKSSISGVVHRPVQLLFMEYPMAVDVINLRKSNRVDCLFPVKLELPDKCLDGMITNISRDGCRIGFNKIERDKACELSSGSELDLSFNFLGSERSFSLKSVIKNVYSEKVHSIGVQFEHINNEIKQEIEKYVDDLKQYFTG